MFLLVSALLIIMIGLRLGGFKQITVDHFVIVIALCVLFTFAIEKTWPRREHFDGTANTSLPASPANTDINRIKFLNNLLSGTPSSTTSRPSNGSRSSSQATSTNTTSDNADLNMISNNLQMYVTTYGLTSYSGNGKTWYDISPGDHGSTSTSQGELATRDMTCTDEPVYHQSKGIFLGRNVLTGPLSSMMGINGSGEFTMFIVCKHDELPEKATINMLQLFGNSVSNNGLSLNIVNVNHTPVQYGNFTLAFESDNYTSSTPIPLDPDVVYLYVINKKHSYISLSVLSSINSKPLTIMENKLDTQEVLLSNKAMTMNGAGNWNAFIKAFGVFNYSMQDSDVKTLYDYVMLEEKRQDPLFQQCTQQVAGLSSSLLTIKQCPYSDTICKQCAMVNDWSKSHSLLNADKTCLSAIDGFCSNNTKNEMCVCWDSSNSLYNTPVCKSWRSIFQGNDVSKIDPETLDAIKEAHGLRQVDDVVDNPPNVVEIQETLPNGDILTVDTEVIAQENTRNSMEQEYISQPILPSRTGFWEWIKSFM